MTKKQINQAITITEMLLEQLKELRKVEDPNTWVPLPCRAELKRLKITLYKLLTRMLKF